MNATGTRSYACPGCASELTTDGQFMTCAACAESWPVDDGMPLFITEDLSAPAKADPDVELLFFLAGTLHWRDALARVYKDRKPMRYERIVYDKAADWLALLPLNKDARVLDAGCGWGTLTFQLAQSCAQVNAMDASLTAVRFVRLRAQQDGVRNVFPVRGDALHIPFADNTFDLVVFNGLLEWAGTADTTRNPAEVQAHMLREARRVLKPDGALYVGIENRWAATYFLGQDEGHVKLKFISLLPRPVAAIYHRLRTGTPFAVHTHSLRAYRSMFHAAGFHAVQAYAPLPQYQKFSHLIPLGHLGAMRYYVTTMFAHRKPSARFLRGMVARFGLYRLIPWFAPCFSFIARYQTASPNNALDASPCPNGKECLLCSGRNSIVLFPFQAGSVTPDCVIKISREPLPPSHRAAANNPPAIHAHQGIPRILRTGHWNQHAISVETTAPGRQLDVLIHEHRADLRMLRRYLTMCTDWLFSFQDTARADGQPLAASDTARLVEPLLAAAGTHLAEKRDRHYLKERLHALAASLTGLRLPRVIQHRDFCPSNILIDAASVSVIDWELARVDGDPFYDLFMFLSRFCFSAFADTTAYPYYGPAAAEQYARRFFFDPTAPLYNDISRLMAARCHSLGLNPDAAKLFFLRQEIEKNRNFPVLSLFISSERDFAAGAPI